MRTLKRQGLLAVPPLLSAARSIVRHATTTSPLASADAVGDATPKIPARRRSKRMTYADYDTVLKQQHEQRRQTEKKRSEEGTHEAQQDTSSSTSAAVGGQWTFSSPYARSQPGSAGAASSSSSSSSPFSSARTAFSARLTRVKLLTTLNLFHTCGSVGQLLAQTMRLRAFTAYLHGSVEFYVRKSTAPPLEVAAYGSPALFPIATRTHSIHASIKVNPSARTNANTGDEALAFSPSSRVSASQDRNAVREEKEAMRLRSVLASGDYEQVALLPQRQQRKEMFGELNAGVKHNSEAGSLSSAPSLHATYRGVLQHHVLDCVHVGESRIHSRGLFTAVALPKGTRVIAEPRQFLLYSPDFLRLLADTYEKLPDTYHYTHPTGSLLELVLQPLPHHLLNHSCEANVCCGLSKCFWQVAAASGRAELLERQAHWPYYDDPNSFFLMRDVEAGEELTIDYSHRIAAMFSGENVMRSRSLLLCRCGSPRCRHFVYQQPDAVQQVLRTTTIAETSAKGNAQAVKEEVGASSLSFHIAKELFRLGFDNETVVLSCLPSYRPLVNYLAHEPMTELFFSSSSSTLSASAERSNRTSSAGASRENRSPSSLVLSAEVERHKARKSDLLACYRHVFRLLNEEPPLRHLPHESAIPGGASHSIDGDAA